MREKRQNEGMDFLIRSIPKKIYKKEIIWNIKKP